MEFLASDALNGRGSEYTRLEGVASAWVGHLPSAFWRGPLPEDHLGKALTEGPVVIDAGEPEVFEGGLAQILKKALVRCLRRYSAGPHVLEQRAEVETVHRQKCLARVDFASSRTVI